MIELVEARDHRLTDGGGIWFGNYGRKESEGKDYNEDTNFGKLRRIPHPSLQGFLDKSRVPATGAEGPDLDEVARQVQVTLDDLGGSDLSRWTGFLSTL